MFAYGFEDLTGAQWALLEALAGRTDVTVSLPYEPDRASRSSRWRARPRTDLARWPRGGSRSFRRATRRFAPS